MKSRNVIRWAATCVVGVVVCGAGVASFAYANDGLLPTSNAASPSNRSVSEQDVDWITSDTDAQRLVLPQQSSPPSSQPLSKASAAGPILDAARTVVAKLALPGATEVSAVEYADSKAATVTLTMPGGTSYQIAVQQLPRAMSANEMAGPNTGELSKLATGSELLTVTGSGFVQAILVRSSGLAVNVAIFTNSGDAAKGGSSASELAQVLTTLVDTADVESSIP